MQVFRLISITVLYLLIYSTPDIVWYIVYGRCSTSFAFDPLTQKTINKFTVFNKHLFL